MPRPAPALAARARPAPVVVHVDAAAIADAHATEAVAVTARRAVAAAGAPWGTPWPHPDRDRYADRVAGLARAIADAAATAVAPTPATTDPPPAGAPTVVDLDAHVRVSVRDASAADAAERTVDGILVVVHAAAADAAERTVAAHVLPDGASPLDEPAYARAHAAWTAEVADVLARLADRHRIVADADLRLGEHAIDHATRRAIDDAVDDAARRHRPPGWRPHPGPGRATGAILASDAAWLLARCAPSARRVAAVAAHPDDPYLLAALAAAGVAPRDIVRTAKAHAPDVARDVLAAVAAIAR